ncbi:MAG: ECF-type sigma factor [Planctomycetota bacterium]
MQALHQERMRNRPNSTDTLLNSLYSELRVLAEQRLRRERGDHTLQATALIHEAYLRLKPNQVAEGWESSSHFLRAAAEAMRRILVDHARAKLTTKRGGEWEREQFWDLPVVLPMQAEELIAIHECLDQFAASYPEHAELVKLRIFGGMSHQEAAESLGLSRSSADRLWAFAKVKLFTLMS